MKDSPCTVSDFTGLKQCFSRKISLDLVRGLSGCCCFFGHGCCCDFVWMQLGLYAQVLPNMLCNWLRLKENESRCHQNNLWTNHFVTLQVSPRLAKDRERFPPNNILFMLFGTGLLWMSWTCFNGGDPCVVSTVNGGDPCVVSTDASLAVLNTVDWECFHYGLKQCFSHSQSTEKYQNV
ncbi:hypothetical protein POPTR_005G054900v4 [Populus trichocarpa]|uniref:Uncharacterized protein n=1 Tax=Populus trichocarpa TaxID=3694 RepID=A0ACC0SY42_POPTR|nr:hypothetical protein POPTR_005G054900v4 [Populus trichocarpa]|eukprot:XP_024456545.1 uncharacterized protein LOC18098983 isoform X2 [Populus trichocarpa]